MGTGPWLSWLTVSFNRVKKSGIKLATPALQDDELFFSMQASIICIGEKHRRLSLYLIHLAHLLLLNRTEHTLYSLRCLQHI